MVIDGWTIFAHPLLLDRATVAIDKAAAADPDGYRRTAQAKLLAMMRKLIFETIPADPTRPDCRQGDTLGHARKHWFQAKFGNVRFRLFFRYDGQAKVIVCAWVHDQDTLRARGSKIEAYCVFKNMLDTGNSPDDWQTLLAAASGQAAIGRLGEIKPD